MGFIEDKFGVLLRCCACSRLFTEKQIKKGRTKCSCGGARFFKVNKLTLWERLSLWIQFVFEDVIWKKIKVILK